MFSYIVKAHCVRDIWLVFNSRPDAQHKKRLFWNNWATGHQPVRFGHLFRAFVHHLQNEWILLNTIMTLSS